MKKTRAYALVTLAIIFGFVIGHSELFNFTGSLFYQKGEYSLPKSRIIQAISHNKNYAAEILMDEGSRAFYFAIQRSGGSKLIIDSEIAQSNGYHDPEFKLAWDETNRKVQIIVDHDFGEGNLIFSFDVNTLELSPVDK